MADEQEGVLGQQAVPEVLLPAAGNSRCQPVPVGHLLGMNDLDHPGRQDLEGGEDVREGVEGAKSLVDRDFQDGSGGIQGTVYGAHALAVPAPAKAEGTFAAVPGRGVLLQVEPPPDETT